MRSDMRVTSAKLAKSFLSNPVDEPNLLQEEFLEPMMRDDPMGLIHIMYAGFQNFLVQKGASAGMTPGWAHAGKGKKLCSLDLKQQSKLATLLAESHSGNVRVRKNGKDFLVSLPITPITTMFNVGAGGGTNEFSPTNILKADAYEYEKIYASLGKFFKAVVGKQADGILEVTKPWNAVITDMKTALSDSTHFSMDHVSEEEPFIVKAIKKWMVGYRLISPPMDNGQRHAFASKLKNDVPRDQWPDLKDAVNPEAFYGETVALRSYQAYCEIHVPFAFAQYLTQSPKAVKLSDLSLWFNLWMMRDLASFGGNRCPNALSSISSIRERIPDLTENRSRISNKNNLSITKEGIPMYLPPFDNVDNYEKEWADAGATPGGEFSLRDAGRLPDNRFTFGETVDQKRENKKTYPVNRVILTDYTNYRFSYSTPEGVVNTVDLEDWMALNASHVAAFFERPLFDWETTWGAVFYQEMNNILNKRVGPAGIDLKQEVLNDPGSQELNIAYLNAFANNADNWGSFAQTYLKFYFAWTKTINPDERPDVPLQAQDLKVKHLFTGHVPGLGWVATVMRKLSKKLETDANAIMDFAATRSVPNALKELGFIMTMGKYGPAHEEVYKKDQERRAVYLKPVLKKDHKPIPLPYVQKDRKIYPHQNKVDNYLTNNDAKFVVMAVDAGGGKTMMVLRDLMMRLHKGTVKRPLIVCPSKLITGYVGEAAYVYGGGLNMFPLTTDIMKEYGEERILEMLQNAPRNTIVVTSYQFLAGDAQQAFYGPSTVSIYRNSEIVRSFGADIIYCDESHDLRNDSQRTLATRRVAYDIPNRGIASGTLVNNQLSDIPNQFSLFDPSIFGTKQQFLEMYALDYQGNTVRQWKPGAENAIRKKIAEHALLITCRRKEWAALLPEKVERILTQEPDKDGAWFQAYEAILKETLDNIKKNKKLVEKLEKTKEEDAEDADDEIAEAGLKPYIARLEQFLTAPETDPAAKMLGVLKEKGPKIAAINTILDEHFKVKKVGGKVLIFTSYHRSADSIYENMKPEYKKHFIRYRAATSERDIAEFSRNPDIWGMVGTENTLNTGHNLQAASRLIRVESIWTPGNLLQSEARVYRPDPKMLGGKRNKVYLDWVIVDSTIDITKMARLISKILTKARFDEGGNKDFDDLKPLPPVFMTLENMATYNSFETGLREYAEEYSKYQTLQNEDLEAYRNDPKNDLVIRELAATLKGLEGAALMKNIPYTNAMTLGDKVEKDLGLMRMTDYVAAYGEGETVTEFDPTDLPVHTEWGDGVVTSSTDYKMKVLLENGTKISVRKLASFVRVDKSKMKVNVRKELSRILGLPLIAASGKIITKDKDAGANLPRPEPEDETKETKRVKPKTEEKLPKGGDALPPPAKTKKEAPAVEVAIEPIAVYDLLGLEVENIDDLSDQQFEALQKFGFKQTGPYVLANIYNKKQYHAFVDKMLEEFEVSSQHQALLEKLGKAFDVSKSKLFQAHIALGMDISNFWRMQSKPCAKNQLKPYPVILDGELSLAFRAVGQPAIKQLRSKVRVPGVDWDVIDKELLLLVHSKQEALQQIAKLEKAGFTIHKPKAFAKSLQAVIMTKPKKAKA